LLSSPFATTARQDIVRLCHSGLDSVSLRREVMRRLRRTLPVDSFWFATVDPTTLLFTGALAEAIPEKATPLFVANEFLQNDVNKWTQLAAARPSVNSLYFATKGRLLALQLLLLEMSESMGNHDSEVVDASSVD
jgi:hypothetical protein